MAKLKADLLQGTLDLLILKTLELEPMHGWGVTQRIQQVSDSVLQVNQGSLYPALHRLEGRGGIRPFWGSSENDRQVEQNLARGMNREEAMRKAAIMVGGAQQLKDDCRDARLGRWIETLMQ